MSIRDEFKIDSLKAADGSKIGYRVIGDGPALILLHGGLQSSLNFTTLATALAADFKVYIPDRRGRGLSEPYKEQDDLPTEAGDLLNLIQITGARLIFALSSGAIITMLAALSGPDLQKIALYEPPIPVDSVTLRRTQANYEKAMKQKNPGKAFITIIKGTGDPGDRSLLNILPAFITAPLVNVMMRAQQKKGNDDELPLAALVPTFQYDCKIFDAAHSLIDNAKAVKAEVLLLGGSKSQPYLTKALDHLEKVLPHVSRIRFEKLGHLAADNSESPLVVAEVLKNFFSKNR